MTELMGVLMLKLSLISSVWISTVVVSGLDFLGICLCGLEDCEGLSGAGIHDCGAEGVLASAHVQDCGSYVKNRFFLYVHVVSNTWM